MTVYEDHLYKAWELECQILCHQRNTWLGLANAAIFQQLAPVWPELPRPKCSYYARSGFHNKL